MTTGWLYKGTAADREAMLAAAAEAESKVIPSDIIVRGHLHMKHLCKTHGKWVLLQPAWKVVNPYAMKAMGFYKANLLTDIGAMVLATHGHGDVSWEEYEYANYKAQSRDLAAPARLHG
jgi:hypothetical protein